MQIAVFREIKFGLCVGVDVLIGPNLRPPAGHCEERSDVAIRSPPGAWTNLQTCQDGGYGFPHQSADWFGMTLRGTGVREQT
jgi:hypothetical protein